MTQSFVVHSGPFAGERLALDLCPRERVLIATVDGRNAVYQHCGWAEENCGAPAVVFIGWDPSQDVQEPVR